MPLIPLSVRLDDGSLGRLHLACGGQRAFFADQHGRGGEVLHAEPVMAERARHRGSGTSVRGGWEAIEAGLDVLLWVVTRDGVSGPLVASLYQHQLSCSAELSAETRTAGSFMITAGTTAMPDLDKRILIRVQRLSTGWTHLVQDGGGPWRPRSSAVHAVPGEACSALAGRLCGLVMQLW